MLELKDVVLASILLRKACLYENVGFPYLVENVGFPYLVENVAPSQVGVLPCMNNMTSHWLPNHSIGLTFERVSVFFFFFIRRKHWLSLPY